MKCAVSEVHLQNKDNLISSLTAEHAGIALGLHLPRVTIVFINIHDGISQLALYPQQSEDVIHVLRLDQDMHC